MRQDAMYAVFLDIYAIHFHAGIIALKISFYLSKIVSKTGMH